MALCIGAGLLAATPAAASSIGADLIQTTTERLHAPDVENSQDSSVVRTRELGLWHLQWDPQSNLNVNVEHEDYALRAADGTDLIDLSMVKAHPRLRLKRERWALDAAVLALWVGRPGAWYARLAEDDRSQFLLPALVMDATPRPVLLRVGYWEEYDVLALPAESLARPKGRYALAVTRVLVMGLGYEFTSDAVARLDLTRSSRFYPAEFTLKHTDAVAEFRLKDPLSAGEAAIWRETSMELTRQHHPYSGESYAKLLLAGVVRFATGSVTHFFTPRLRFTDSYVAYHPDNIDSRTLLEEVVDRNDASLGVSYEAFSRLGAASLLIAWGGDLEVSVLRRVERTFSLHVKLEYLY